LSRRLTGCSQTVKRGKRTHGAAEKTPSRILILIHADNRANREALATIGRLFQQRHGMAVLQVVQQVQVSDPDWTAARLHNRQLSGSP
jgi:hypothetical protein